MSGTGGLGKGGRGEWGRGRGKSGMSGTGGLKRVVVDNFYCRV